MASLKKIVKNIGRFSDKMSFGANRKIRKVLHLRGKNWQSALGFFRNYGVNSAGSYYSSSGAGSVYGPTGSIVGRY